MKTFVLLLVALAAWGLPAHAQDAIHPIIAPAFGKQVTVRAEFVAKPNTYYAQNMVSAPCILKVVAVNGHDLNEPVLIEYNLHAGEKNRAKIERPGIISVFEAYESLYQPATATPWLADGEQGMSFVLIHLLHVRVPQGRTR